MEGTGDLEAALVLVSERTRIRNVDSHLHSDSHDDHHHQGRAFRSMSESIVL